MQPPRKTASRAKSACSSSVSSSYDHSIVARSVRWRSGRVAAAREQVEPLLEPLEDLSRREGLHPRGRQLERERQVVEAPADLGDSLVAGEVRFDRPCARA